MKHYVGLDVSLNETAICVVNEDGTIVREGKTLSEPEAIGAWLANLACLSPRSDLKSEGLLVGFTSNCALPGCLWSASTHDGFAG